MTKVKSLSTDVEKNKQESSRELVKRESIKDTPFEVITIEEESFGVMGEYRITEKYNKKEEVKEELEKINWNRIIQIIMILTEYNNKNKK